MKRIRPILAAVLVLFAAGCAGAKPAEEEEAAVLTGVYRGEELRFPDGCSPSETAPLYDGDLGTLTFYGTDAQDEGTLFRVSPDSGVLGAFPLSMPEGFHPGPAAFSIEYCYCIGTKTEISQGGNGPPTAYRLAGLVLRRFSASDGTLLGECDLTALLATYGALESDFGLLSIVVTPDGTVWIKTDTELLLLTPEMEKIASILVKRNSGFLAPTPENKVWLVLRESAELYSASSQTPEKRLTDLPEDVTAAAYAPDGTLYLGARSGIYKVIRDGENEAARFGLVMDYVNSNVKRARLMTAFGDDAFLLHEDTAGYQGVVSLYTRSEDVDLSLIDTVEVAAAFDSSTGRNAPTDLIVEYNKAHPETVVILRDYSIYSTSENPDGGQNRLLTDIVTGIYRPDIVISDTVDPIRRIGGTVSDVLVKKDLCADLAPYLAGDLELDPDNLFGAVKRLFRTEDGGMWGIADTFQIYTLAASESVLGQHADGWTLGEFLDFAERWPSSLLLCRDINREQFFTWTLGPNALESFLDRKNASCSFDNPEFVRLLRFWLSLPATAADWVREAPFKYQSPEAYDYLHTGKIALFRTGYYQLGDITSTEAALGTKDWIVPGYPGEAGRGSPVFCEKAYMLLKTSKKPDLAADVIRELVREAHTYGIPAMKSRYDELAPQELTHYAIHYFDGAVVAGSLRDNDPRTKPLKRAGYICVLEENDLARFRGFLDEKAGYPMTDFVASEIQAIVAEELSALGAGVGTAEECAAKIQSRVSIWMAENR